MIGATLVTLKFASRNDLLIWKKHHINNKESMGSESLILTS